MRRKLWTNHAGTGNGLTEPKEEKQETEKRGQKATNI
jgi:hypothetical protein